MLESQQDVDAAITTIMEEEDLKPLDKEVGIRDCVSPRKGSATPCGGDEFNAVEDVQDSTKIFFFSLNSEIYYYYKI